LANACDPIQVFDKRPSGDELSGGSIDNEGVAPFIDIDEELTHAAIDLAVDKDVLVGGVPIPNVVGDLLMKPFQFPCIDVESHDGIGV
jgi:hypothetical protein